MCLKPCGRGASFWVERCGNRSMPAWQQAFATKAIEGAGHFVQQREIAAWPFLLGWLVVPMAR